MHVARVVSANKYIRYRFIARFHSKNAYKETHSESILPPSADLFGDTTISVEVPVTGRSAGRPRMRRFRSYCELTPR